MRFPRHARNFKRILYAPITIIGLVVLSVVLIRAAIGAYRNDSQNEENFRGVVQNASEMQAREQFLQNEIERLTTDRGVEEELRSKFPVAKEGENMVIIVEPETSYDRDSALSKKGFWSGVIDFFR